MPDLGLSWPLWVWASVVVFAAGLVRGYTGFGFSMIAVLGLSLILPPKVAVPAVLLLEVGASSYLLPRVYGQVNWPAIRLLAVGVLIGTPLGLWALDGIPARPMRAGVAGAVLVLVILLKSGFRMKQTPGRAGTAGTGILCGLLNGGAAVGGPPAILFFFSTPGAAAVGRASLIAFFLVTDFLAAGMAAVGGVMGLESVVLAAATALPMLTGAAIGGRSFIRTPEERFRGRVTTALLVLAAASLIRAAIG
jgi:hypothetical protein